LLSREARLSLNADPEIRKEENRGRNGLGFTVESRLNEPHDHERVSEAREDPVRHLVDLVNAHSQL